MTVQVWPAEYAMLAVHVPVPASAKSSPVAPCVSTVVDPSVPPLTMVKVRGITGLVVPMFTAPKLVSGGALTKRGLTVTAR